MTKAKSAKRAAATTKAAPVAPATDDLDRVFAVVARYFSVLSEPTRLRIMHTICQEERSVTAVVATTGFTQTNVSRHLALMHSVRVVSRRREGNGWQMQGFITRLFDQPTEHRSCRIRTTAPTTPSIRIRPG